MVLPTVSYGMLFLMAIYWCSSNVILGEHPQLLQHGRQQGAHDAHEQGYQQQLVLTVLSAAARSHLILIILVTRIRTTTKK
eukprot:3819879-Prymnesium_polylepis.1